MTAIPKIQRKKDEISRTREDRAQDQEINLSSSRLIEKVHDLQEIEDGRLFHIAWQGIDLQQVRT